MYSPRGRTGRTPGGAGPLVAALALALMGTGGVALAAPKGDPGPPEHAQGNGPAPPAQANGQPPQAEDVAPAPKAKAKGPDRAGGPGELPPQAGGNGDPGSVNHGQAPGEVRGQGLTRSKAGRANGCQAARCQGGAPQPSGPQPSGDASGGGEQPQPVGGAQGPAAGDVPGVSDPTRARPDDDRAGTPHGESESGDSPELGSVQGLNQGGGEEAYRARGTFDGALPFTGFELALLAAMGALLAVAGVWVRSTA